MTHKTRFVVSVAGLAVVVGVRLAAAQAADPDPARFQAEIKAFEDVDRKNTSPKDAVLFIGSSSIRLWNTADSFSSLTVINRGFGGAYIADVNHYFEQTVRKYAPRAIVFYAGDNDLGNGRHPDRVLADYQTFVERVHAARPETEIFFLAVKPSLARWKLWPGMKAFNERVRAFSSSRPRLHFIDIAPPMLGADGQPRAELFVEDGLHMTPAGYEIWNGLVSRALTPFGRK